MKSIKSLILLLTLFFCFSQLVKAQSDPMAYVYFDGWWDMTPQPGGESLHDPDTEEDLGWPEGAYFTFSSQITTYSNPFIDAQCQWNQNNQLLDLSIEDLVQMTGSWGSPNSSVYSWWNFTDGGSFEARTWVSVTGPCNNHEIPQPALPVQTEIVTPQIKVGLSYMTYLFYGPWGRASWKYIHRVHANNMEKAKCCDETRQDFAVYDPEAGTAIKLVAPWGDYIPDCIGGLYWKNANPAMFCYDVNTN